MAYIYSKNTGVCWIIGTQEGVIYPFSFTSFKEIRMGGFFSIVSGGTLNSGFLQTAQNLSGPKTTFYMGFKDSGSSLPEQTGSTFFGVSRVAGDTNINITASLLTFGTDTAHGYGNIITTDTNGGINFFSTNQNGITIANPTPDTNFASFWGITLGLIGNTFSGMALYSTSNYTDITTGNLSNLVNNPPSVSTFVTGYYTTGNLNNTNSLLTPNSIFIYFPFFSNNLRIHSLDIEKFS